MNTGAPGVLLVHAHPDDETITNGVTMAAAVAAGRRVTLVTCTLGEEGEVIPPDLAHLAPDRENRLGPHRIGELAAAMAELGVTDHRFLGGPGRWRDSGMMGAPQNDRPDSLWRSDDDEAAGALAAVIRETRPAVLLTYDPNGGYGHPDHIRAHRIATRAVELAAEPGPAAHRVPRILWTCVPRSAAERALGALRAAGPGRFAGVADLDAIPGVVDDEQVVVTVVGGPREIAAKRAAMRAHATQIDVGEEEVEGVGPVFALSNGLVQPLWTTEWFRLGAGSPPPPGAKDPCAGPEPDEPSAPSAGPAVTPGATP
ncbi:N-acetyl-1-D-myo-inositol-2-amino-2-deoxy-alpha-D-glucopyranoside deacetylase [Streptomyces alkaliphilus]|uniref:1D-myo-inositol 2-acetamido-2-deoxy-alpha-D-glucopyranoside deacetylase n=1 Tax=Streptomyces alkaliphilus TaxID=1472722 RepID=A0A7W3TGH0_9ACTN|nr:N-acetyl-1-D-myo-inositol-2-amino-2-deoxy-alpha-D-glucopyranoside deacetylase [Streptomyces alkaliphilus]MBB0246393.1 N-acetyl-1-D-myo-inositol-2-amino-2-deoxy-alpha-D-glucopyranoside deacetylase [Streptomyces alkaliphilus]